MVLLGKVCLILALVNSISMQCSVNIREDISRRDPVYLSKNGSLWAPKGASLDWEEGEETIVVCSGTANSLSLNGQTTSSIICLTNTTFSVEGSVTDALSLECHRTITGDFQATKRRCGNDTGYLINLGFNGELGFTTYIQSCYDMLTGSVRYTRHPLPGQAIQYSVSEPSRPSFKSGGTAPHVRPATAYTQASQLNRLTELLGSVEEAEKYLGRTSFLARGHLAPDADGIYRSWSFTTYFFTNAAPKWQVVNAGNWLRVENLARRMASSLQTELDIYTGTFGILKLPDINGNPVEITLEAGGNIEVPKWFWKIIRNPEDNSGIAFVTLNNPFVEEIEDSEKLCQDICKSTGWYAEAFDNFRRGYTYCCEVDELMKTIQFIPKEAAVSEVLRDFSDCEADTWMNIMMEDQCDSKEY